MNNLEQENFENLLEYFYEFKQRADDNKKLAETYNKRIKEEMDKMNITEFEGEQYKAKITIQNRESFNETNLLKKLKNLDISGVIKTKEYVDMEALEDAIYNGKLNASELADCKESKEVVILKVTERKN